MKNKNKNKNKIEIQFNRPIIQTVLNFYNEWTLHSPDDNTYRWERLFHTGDFNGCYDYELGSLQVDVFVRPYHFNNKKHECGIKISSYDDGEWEATCLENTKDEAFRTANRIRNIFPNEMCRLPSEEILNEKLTEINMLLFGENTG